MPPLICKLLDVLCLPGKWLSWLILPLIVSILAAIIAATYGQNTLVAWEAKLPIVGRALTVNGLIDLQWHIFALLVLFGGVWALRDEQHVSVDFLSLMMPPKLRLLIRSLGDLLFLLPFCLIITWYGWSFAEVAWRSGEGSTQGGLQHRWLIKAALPLAFSLLGVMALSRGLATLSQIFFPREKE